MAALTVAQVAELQAAALRRLELCGARSGHNAGAEKRDAILFRETWLGHIMCPRLCDHLSAVVFMPTCCRCSWSCFSHIFLPTWSNTWIDETEYLEYKNKQHSSVRVDVVLDNLVYSNQMNVHLLRLQNVCAWFPSHSRSSFKRTKITGVQPSQVFGLI